MSYFTPHRQIGIALSLAVAVFFYACWVEPYWIETTHHEIKGAIKSPLKICHLSDLHVRSFGVRERRVLAIIEEEKPDAILISGDSFIDPDTVPALKAFLAKLKAPLGVWGVRGNWENWHRVPKEAAFYRDLGMRFLVNEATSLRDDVWIVGFDDASSGVPTPETTLSKVPAEIFKIGLFHAPGFFLRIAGRIDLSLAGHTHGGQLRLPFLPPLYLPPGCRGFVQGWYQQNGSKMFVSRGIGTSILNMRFLARPEVAIINITTKE